MAAAAVAQSATASTATISDTWRMGEILRWLQSEDYYKYSKN